MGQWLSNLAPWEIYLIAAPSVMLGAILLVGGILPLLAPRNKNDAETLEAIRKELEKAGAEFNDCRHNVDAETGSRQQAKYPKRGSSEVRFRGNRALRKHRSNSQLEQRPS